MDLRDRIERYCSVFEGYLDSVDAIEVDERDLRYKKILCLSHIEGLAAGRFAKKGPRDRFIRLVRGYGSWPDATRVSTPHLVAALERTENTALDEFRADLYREYRRWGSGGPVPVARRDPDFEDVVRRWPQRVKGSIRLVGGQLLLRNLRLVELLYDYRNYLVHEAREPTLSFEDPDDSAPLYESVGSTDGSQEWHLVFPYGFLIELARSCIGNLRSELLSTGRDPYAGYCFGKLVRQELNDVRRFPVVFPYGGSDPSS